MKVLVSSLILIAGFATCALGGPNRGGTLLLHAATELLYTRSVDTYCPSANTVGCDDVQVRVETQGAHVIQVFANFAPEARPRLRGLTFGLQYPSNLEIVDWGGCSDFALCELGWPGSGSSTALTWNDAQRGSMIPVYWFAVQSTDGQSATLRLTEHRLHGAKFADDETPSVLDEIGALGSLGFFEDGFAPCAEDFKYTGACCFPDATCRYYTERECLRDGGVYQGNEVPCEAVSCPVAIGGCCLRDGSCQTVSILECLEIEGGTWWGPEYPCDPNPCPQPGPDRGACCFGDGNCQLLMPIECESLAGSFVGLSIDCGPTTCEDLNLIGACCFADESCHLVTLAACGASNGLWLGEPACHPDPCFDRDRLGACCYSGGACDITTRADCRLGTFTADGTCDPNPCPDQAPTGACCHLDGACGITSESECHGRGGFPPGMYQGDGTLCDPSPCPLPPATGACCDPRGRCVLVNEAFCSCKGGLYLGDGVQCSPDPCGSAESGACCLADESCRIMVASWCDVSGGEYEGDGTSCSPYPCGVAEALVGACCFPDGTCINTGTDACAEAYGLYHGDGARCELQSCLSPSTPTVRATWGQIKVRF